MNHSSKLSICLYSDSNFLAVNLLESLLSKNCYINIITGEVNEWRVATNHLATKNLFGINNKNSSTQEVHYDYAIFCGGFIKSNEAYQDYTDFVSLSGIVKAKTIAIFPFELFDRNKFDRIKVSGNTAVIFIGDLLGPRINLNSELLVSRTLSEIIWDRKITLAVGEMFYPIFIADAVRTISKWLFSFGPYGKATLLLGSGVSGDTFWNVNQKLVGQLELKYNQKEFTRTVPQGIDTEIVANDLNFSLTETYRWLRDAKLEKPKKIISRKPVEKVRLIPKRPVPKRTAPKNLNKILAFLFIILIFPLLCLLISVFATLVAYKSFLAGRDNATLDSLLLSRTFAVVSEKESGFMGYIPAVGLIYKEIKFASVFSEDVSDLGIHAIPVARDLTQLFEKVLGTQIYNSGDISLKLGPEVSLVYNDMLSMKNLTEDASDNHVILANKILGRIDFERFINLVSQCKILIGNAPQILGQDKSKTYMVLFQNNMELRPTGGFIGSFGLLTFDGGRLTDLTVNDVYSADGQLNGHVEPPAPIKNYLGEANWWLRDSNWDPDFPTSAKRAEWFLDKEISKQVDGVVAVDLFPIKEILKSTGPVFLSDYNLNITSDNLYEETQAEVQSDFFPGTHQKASFLTSLSRNLLSEISKPGSGQILDIARAFYDGLDERHIQVYLHDNTSQEATSALNWDGAVASPTCGAGCYPDLVGVVEANVGDNKANYFIQRNINLDLTVTPSEIDRTLTLNLKNTANPALGPSGKYKNYVRIIIPSDATLISVKSITGNTQEILSPDITDVRGHKEVGVLVEVLGGDSKSVEFSWTSNIAGSSPLASYGLYFRKQAGTDADPIGISINDHGVEFNADPRFALTKGGTYLYNTTLVRDLFSRFSW